MHEQMMPNPLRSFRSGFLSVELDLFARKNAWKLYFATTRKC